MRTWGRMMKLEHGMGFEPMNNGFAGRRVSHFATRAHVELSAVPPQKKNPLPVGSGFRQI
jgi:hypothetical protein